MIERPRRRGATPSPGAWAAWARAALCASLLLAPGLSAAQTRPGSGAAHGPDPAADPAAALDLLDRRIIDVAAAQRAARAQTAAAQAELGGIEAAVNGLQEAVAAGRDRLSRRLMRHRRLDERAFSRALLAAEDRGTLLRVRLTLRSLLAADLAALKRLRDDEARLAEARAARREGVARIEAHAAAVEAQRAELEDARAERAALVRAIAREAHLRARLSAAQAAGSEALAAALEQSLPADDPDAGFAAEQGRLPAPVPGRLLEAFGVQRDATLGTRTRAQGWRIEAVRGAPVRSIFEGRVGYAGWYQGFGNLVIVDHGAGWISLYGHLDAVLVQRGEAVAVGAPVGEVGDTGALDGPQLYFEIRARRVPVDPALWLRPGPIAGLGAPPTPRAAGPSGPATGPHPGSPGGPR